MLNFEYKLMKSKNICKKYVINSSSVIFYITSKPSPHTPYYFLLKPEDEDNLIVILKYEFIN